MMNFFILILPQYFYLFFLPCPFPLDLGWMIWGATGCGWIFSLLLLSESIVGFSTGMLYIVLFTAGLSLVFVYTSFFLYPFKK